jgi:hypothetical protein
MTLLCKVIFFPSKSLFPKYQRKFWREKIYFAKKRGPFLIGLFCQFLSNKWKIKNNRAKSNQKNPSLLLIKKQVSPTINASQSIHQIPPKKNEHVCYCKIKFQIIVEYGVEMFEKRKFLEGVENSIMSDTLSLKIFT